MRRIKYRPAAELGGWYESHLKTFSQPAGDATLDTASDDAVIPARPETEPRVVETRFICHTQLPAPKG